MVSSAYPPQEDADMGPISRLTRFEAESLDLEEVLLKVREMVCMLDAQWRFTFVNQQFLALYGLTSAAEAIGRTPFDIYPDFKRSVFHQALKVCCADQKPGANIGYSGKTGGYHLCRYFPHKGGAIIFASDISEEFANQEKLARRAIHDPLTSLPNRIALEQDTALLFQASAPFSIVFIDLDRFKTVNDVSGHAVGDHVLMEMGYRFTQEIEAGGRIYRTGGDEFVLLTSAVAGVLDTQIRSLLDSASRPLVHKHNEFVLGASAGVATFPQDGADLETLLRKADLAMYQAKRELPGSVCYFKLELEQQAVNRLQLEQRLRKAVAAGDFEMFYQPQASIRTGTTSGVEALIRWRLNEINSFVPPNVFLPLAVECGLMEQIDDWVMAQTIREQGEMLKEGIAVKVAINLSAKAMENRTTSARIQSLLELHEVPGRLLEVEISEAALMNDVTASQTMLNDIASLGVGISIDDFGTGYSSLSYLVRYPIDTLKIDRVFVNDMVKNADSEKVVLTLVRLAGSLNMAVIAEGVETKEQLEMLARFGCDGAQGYYFARPMPLNELKAFLRLNQDALETEPDPYAT